MTLEEYGKECYWEGMEKAKTEIIKLLFDKGKTTEDISELCGFPLEEVEKVRETITTEISTSEYKGETQ